MANNKTKIIELLKNLESTLQEINDAEVNDEDSLKRILKEFCMNFNYDVTDTNELEKLSTSINKILGEIVYKYSKIVKDTKAPVALAEDKQSVPTGGPIPVATGEPIPMGFPLSGGKKRKTKNKKKQNKKFEKEKI